MYYMFTARKGSFFMKNNPDLIINLLYPALIAVLAALFSFWGSYLLNKHNSNEEKRLRTIDLVDFLIIQFNNLLVVLDKLTKDAETLNYFAFANINIGLPIINKLKNKSDQVILFESDKLRKQLVEVIDEASSAIEEINAIEHYPISERDKAESIKAERLREFRNISVELLKSGVYINRENKYKPEYLPGISNLKGAKNQTKLEKAVENLLTDLVADMNASDLKINTINSQNEKLRSFLVIRMLDIQTKIRELNNQLSDLKVTIVN